MATAVLFLLALLGPCFTAAQGTQGSVQLYSDAACSTSTGTPNSLLVEVCLETNRATAIAIVSLPSCTDGSPRLYISDLDRCQNPSFSPLVSSDVVGECLFFMTGSGIDSAYFACSSGATTGFNGQATVPIAASSNPPTLSTGASMNLIISSQVPTLEIASAAGTTSSTLDPAPTALSSSGQPADPSSGLSIANRIALGCGVGIGLPALILGYLNWRKRSPEPPPPYELHDFGH